MILCSGAFDGLHSGHVAYLEAARAIDPDHTLAVAVAPDNYIRTVKHREPRWSQAQRARVVQALAVVDLVILQPELSVAGTVRKYRPAMLVKGLDWVQTLPADVAQACVDAGTTMTFTDTEHTHSRQVDWTAIGAAL